MSDKRYVDIGMRDDMLRAAKYFIAQEKEHIVANKIMPIFDMAMINKCAN